MPLELGHRPALGRDDFLVGESNRAAVAWIDAWPNWPVRAIALHGPPQSGKSHLAEVWRARSGAILVDGPLLVRDRVPDMLSDATAVVIEAADRVVDEPALLHFYNLVMERSGYLLMTACSPPNRWGTRLADLRSRLATMTAVELGAPDDALFKAILAKLFSDRQVVVGDEVVDYLAARLERSIAAAFAAVTALDRDALALGRPITVPMARVVLGLSGRD